MKHLLGECGTDPRTIAGRAIPALLMERAARHPQQVFMRTKHHGVWREHAWAEVLVQVREFAAGMAAQGVGAGDRVAMISENIAEAFVAEYATHCRGAGFVGIYPDIGTQELLYLLSHSGSRLVFAEDQEQVDKVLAIRDQLPALQAVVYVDARGLWDYRQPALLDLKDFVAAGRADAAAAQTEFERVARAVRLEDVAVVSYTSGTTGRPKGAQMTHRQLLDSAYRVMAAFRLPAHADYLSYISLAWAAEQITGVGLGVLAPLVVNFAEKPETIQHDLRELGPQFLLFAPRQWEMISSNMQSHMLEVGALRRALYRWAMRTGAAVAEAPEVGMLLRARHWLADRLVLRALRDNIGLRRTHAALSAGSGLSAEIFGLFRALGVPLHNVYGATESGLLTAHWRGRFKAETMGRILPTCPTLNAPVELCVDDSGELLTRGGTVFAGYLGDAEASAQAFDAQGWLRTGDAVRLDDAGDLIFLDRVKDLRRLAGGHVFPPQFIESHLRASPFIRDAIVIGDETRASVTALINIDGEIFRRWCEQRGLAAATFTEMSQLEPIRREVAAAVAAVNRLLDPPARVLRFANLPKDLDPDDSELTRSRKLRRNVIDERYAAIIDALYGSAPTCLARIRIQYQDGGEGTLTAPVHINTLPEPT